MAQQQVTKKQGCLKPVIIAVLLFIIFGALGKVLVKPTSTKPLAIATIQATTEPTVKSQATAKPKATIKPTSLPTAKPTATAQPTIEAKPGDCSTQKPEALAWTEAMKPIMAEYSALWTEITDGLTTPEEALDDIEWIQAFLLDVEVPSCLRSVHTRYMVAVEMSREALVYYINGDQDAFTEYMAEAVNQMNLFTAEVKAITQAIQAE
jgi:hypothetical protein